MNEIKKQVRNRKNSVPLLFIKPESPKLTHNPIRDTPQGIYQRKQNRHKRNENSQIEQRDLEIELLGIVNHLRVHIGLARNIKLGIARNAENDRVPCIVFIAALVDEVNKLTALAGDSIKIYLHNTSLRSYYTQDADFHSRIPFTFTFIFIFSYLFTIL